ncbi:MAG: DEAD/DEAH box helicase [Oscillospiraceae bacterium]
MYFKDLALIPEILKAVETAGYENPSPIQEKAIPSVLEGKDLLGCAQTGTGKTAAFAMPILQNLNAAHLQQHYIRALILTPTRELALQISESFEAYGKYLPLRTCVIFGGVKQNPQTALLKKGVDILVATPGRLNDLVNQGFIKLDRVEIFVLDEADRMLDMGFVHDVKRILGYLPSKKQTLLFSATMPKEIEELVNTLLHNPTKVFVTPPSSTVDAIAQSLYFVDKANKRFLLASLIKDGNIKSSLVFTRTKHGADRVVKELAKDGVEAMAIHGNKSQNARQLALGKFKSGELRVLVATDIAARGIDINELSHVFNYDLPNIPETYVHRIGRTGRAGQIGASISFCDFDEMEYLADIEKLTGKKIPVVQEHRWPMVVLQKSEKKTQQRPARDQSRTPKQARQPQPKQPQRAVQSPKGAVQSRNNSSKDNRTAAPQRTQHNNRTNADRPHTTRQGAKPFDENAPQPGDISNLHTRQNVWHDTPPLDDKTVNRFKKREMYKNSPNPIRKEDKPMNNGQKPNPNFKKQNPVNRTQPQRTAPVAAKAPITAAIETDDSTIKVISRKAPSQKFASFDDFIKNQKD